ncbi:MAG: hypothetical protein ABR616_10800 [Dermatophilaceae bacterium]|nr:hypothetical protein [Intrasporangiaceae bacterium]
MPRWLLLEDHRTVVGLDRVAERLRELLNDDPPSAPFDDRCEEVLSHFLQRAQAAEVELLPRRHQRALEQMHRVSRDWAEGARAQGRTEDAERWENIAAVAKGESDAGMVDLYQASEAWLTLVKPARLAARTERRRSSYSRLVDIEPILERDPLHLGAVEDALARLGIVEPLAQRASACILGVPI